MAALYKQFLASPNQSLLAENASLHYVTTLINVAGAAEIMKHLAVLRKQLSKKKEDILNVVEGAGAAVFEIETALEFITSGGSYLPGLDDNFLSDHVAYTPITHFVSFDGEGKITQIRLQWDQGALLKQLEIIGRSGRNWPIHDSREQLRQLQSCLKSAGKNAQQTSSHGDVVIRTRHGAGNALRDPHASLQLFGNREELESAELSSAPVPYSGHRPKQRSFADILGDEPEDRREHGHSRERSASPSKAGQGKNNQPMRIFDGAEEAEEVETPKGKPANKHIKPHPTKYNHFDFADGSDPSDAPNRGVAYEARPKSKHDSQWSFDDFVTPAKPKAGKGKRSEEVHHWDTETQFKDDPSEHHVGKGRRDAETHFELQDDGERVGGQQRAGRPRGAMQNEAMGLYKNQLFDQGEPTPGPKRALGNITNVKDRGKDFDAHFTMTDNSPAPAEKTQQHVSEARKKVVKMMDHNWEVYDESPQKENKPRPAAVKENTSDAKIHIAGDGMGGRKGTDRNWLYGGGGDDDEEPAPKPPRKAAAGQQKSSFWDF